MPHAPAPKPRLPLAFFTALAALALGLSSPGPAFAADGPLASATPIDRQAVVSRHNVRNKGIKTSSSAICGWKRIWYRREV